MIIVVVCMLYHAIPIFFLRAEGKVCHCRIMVENGNYMIGSAQFDSLTELVQYYETIPLYRRMKLKYAINEEVLRSIGDISGRGL